MRVSYIWFGFRTTKLALLLALFLPPVAAAAPAQDATLDVTLPPVAPTGATLRVAGTASGLPAGTEVAYEWREGSGRLEAGRLQLGEDGSFSIEVVPAGSGEASLALAAAQASASASTRVFPGWLSILPPLLAIGLAMLTRQVVVSLFAGILLGAIFYSGFDPGRGILRVIDRFALEALTDPDHASIVLFSLLLGGMVAVISRAGGMHGIVEVFRHRAHSKRGAQLVGAVLGFLIFFDDYANSLVVGNTMRPLTDRMKVSREKLAYVVDSTSAPVAGIALISTWIGFEVSLIGDAFAALGLSDDSYKTFLSSIPTCFYPILALVFVLLVAGTGRDFGSMLRAERRAATGLVLRPGAVPLAALESDRLQVKPGVLPRWWVALVPIGVLAATVLLGLWWTGRAALAVEGKPLGTAPALEVFTSGNPIKQLGDVFAAASSYKVLLWGSLFGCVAAILLAAGGRKLRLAEAMEAWVGGVSAMVLAIVILTLAWSIGAVCKDLATADWIVAQAARGVPAGLLPALLFVLGGAVSFATGTSWGTMAILFPLAVPLAHHAASGLDPEAAHRILIGTVGSVLSGAIFGDHCSPISDTTVLSSMASGSDHIDHVRTQMPYALLVGVVAVGCGYLLIPLGVPAGVSLLLGTGVLAAALFLLGKRVEEPAAPT
jgi:Na+/H+ antiporter NhaC